MAQQKRDASAGTLSIEDIYNLLMNEIEPDLTTGMIPCLDEIYAGETEEERRARGAWYAQALEIFEERFGYAMDLWKGQFLRLKEAGLTFAKDISCEEEKGKLSDIEQSLDES